MTRRALIALALALALPASASAHKPQHYRLQHHHAHCRHGFHRKAVRRHRRRVVLCVQTKHHRKPHPRPIDTSTPAPTPTSSAPSRTVVLHAHLDPSFTRDPHNPFRVTYAFSASATAEPSGRTAKLAASEPAPLPEGVLALYSDGALECAINVGGEATGGECPVTYAALGEHTVTTIYTSGETAATATEVESIQPIATTTTAALTYEALPVSEALSTTKRIVRTIGGPYGEGVAEEAIIESWAIGSLTLSGATTDELGQSQAPTLVLNGASTAASSIPVTLLATRYLEYECNLRVEKCTSTVIAEHEEMVPEVLGRTFASGGAVTVVAAFAGAGYVSSQAEASTTVPLMIVP